MNQAETNGKMPSAFWVMVQKEVSDHVKSWRYDILLILMALTCIGSLYTALISIRSDAHQAESAKTLFNHSFLFLKLFTASSGTLPPFIQFVAFLGPLIGIALGFDAVNSERNKGTLTRVISQPIARDAILNAKFVAALIVIAVIFFSLGFLVMGLGLILIGIPPTPDEFLRLILFLIVAVVYVAFWLNLAIVFSVRFRQPATSALTSIAIWIFFSVFFSMIINLINSATSSQTADVSSQISHVHFIQFLMRLSPSDLFSEATTTLLMPTVRSLGPLTMDQVIGALPSPLPLWQSLLLSWPELTFLVAATLICFAISYVSFMRQEIRSR